MRHAIGASMLAAAIGLPGLLLTSCGDASPPAPPAPPASSELADLAARAENWASRAERIVERPWASRLEFPRRLHVRLQALRSFVQQAGTAAAAPGGPDPAVVERGRRLVHDAAPFDAALQLAERVALPIDQIMGNTRLTEIHMPPLEQEGEAPFRIRLENLNQQVSTGLDHLDSALGGILEQSPDAALNERIAVGQLTHALETAKKLSEEVKRSSALASATVDRAKLLESRIAWAEKVAAQAGDGVPPEAAKALEEAREFKDGPLPGESAAVLDRLRNAQPDAQARAKELSDRAEAVIARLTSAFLELARRVGVGDPR